MAGASSKVKKTKHTCSVPSDPCTGLGLQSPENADEFAKDLEDLKNRFPKLTEAARQQGFADALNKQLAKSGSPPVRINTARAGELGNRNGFYDFKTGEFVIRPTLFQSSAPSDDEFTAFSRDAFHEARHAEQFNAVARKLATDGLTPAQIQNKTGIPVDPKNPPKKFPRDPKNPKKKSKEEECAQKLYDSIYGKDAKERNDKLKDADKKRTANKDAQGKYNKAQSDYKAAPTKANKAALDQAAQNARSAAAADQAAYNAYTSLPEEVGAFTAQHNLEDALLRRRMVP
jgi:hypothetical protein